MSLSYVHCYKGRIVEIKVDLCEELAAIGREVVGGRSAFNVHVYFWRPGAKERREWVVGWTVFCLSEAIALLNGWEEVTRWIDGDRSVALPPPPPPYHVSHEAQGSKKRRARPEQ